MRGNLRSKEKLVKESPKGCFNDFHRTMLASHYKLYQFLREEVALFETRIAKATEPYASQTEPLITIPGVDRIVAWHLLTELGLDLKAFPDADHCCTRAGMLPVVYRSDLFWEGRETKDSAPVSIVSMSPPGYPSAWIAVGMTIADHPPHRSVLAELPHTAPPLDTSVEALIGIGMKSTRARNPSIKDRPQLFPIRLPPLTATT